MSSEDINLLLFGSINEHRKELDNKQLYVNKVNFLSNF